MIKTLCLMGSGEIAPNMVKVHRKILDGLIASFEGNRTLKACFLATPFTFQENVDELSAKIVRYFKVSLNVDIEPTDIIKDFYKVDIASLDQNELIRTVSNSDFVFAGPGSPSFALERWQNGSLPSLLKEKLKSGGAIVFSSAAALTCGKFTVPVYEIYKVGAKPTWLDGMDILSVLDLNTAVIPHFNNAEGGTHDTRFCYLGQNRLNYLKGLIDDDTVILGIDEHTAVIFDIENYTLEVSGLGCLTVQQHSESFVINSGETISIDKIKSPADKTNQIRQHQIKNQDKSKDAIKSDFDLDELIDNFKKHLNKKEFDLAGKTAATMFNIIEPLLSDDESDFGKKLIRELKILILNIFDDYQKLDIASVNKINSLISLIVEIRNKERKQSNFTLSDFIRDELARMKVQINDSPTGTKWDILN